MSGSDSAHSNFFVAKLITAPGRRTHAEPQKNATEGDGTRFLAPHGCDRESQR